MDPLPPATGRQQPRAAVLGIAKEMPVADKLPPDKMTSVDLKDSRSRFGLSVRGRWWLLALVVSIAAWAAVAVGLAKLLF